MYRQVKYQVKIEPLPQKNLRKNINAFYIVLISEKNSHKLFSQPLLIDSERQNDIYSTNDIEYNVVQLWNYDKMKVVEQQKTAFHISDSLTFTCKSEEIVYSVAKTQVAKSNKIIDPIKSQHSITTPSSSGRKNSEGEYQLLLKTTKNRQVNGSKMTESQEQSSSNLRSKKSPSYRIISAKQYHAY